MARIATLGLVTILVSIAHRAGAEEPADVAEYPERPHGGTLGLPTVTTSATIGAQLGVSDGNVAFDTLLKAGLRLTGAARLFVVAETTRFAVPARTSISTTSTEISHVEESANALGFALTLGRLSLTSGHMLCCSALGRGGTLSTDERAACEHIGVNPQATSCPIYPPPTPWRIGLGLRAISPDGGQKNSFGIAADFNAQYWRPAFDAFASVAGVYLPGWENTAGTGAIEYARVADARISVGGQWHGDAVHLGLVGGYGVQSSTIDGRDDEHWHFDAGVFIGTTNIPKLNQLKVYIGVQRVPGANNRVRLGVQDDEYQVNVRLSPGLSR